MSRGEMARRRRRGEELQMNIPIHFRCPISLDVMNSPVSLCTGVTYDRSSIQRWLEAGNDTCPATMQVLHTTDLVPNHTLRRLIQLWSSTHQHHHPKQRESFGNNGIGNVPPRLSQLLRQIHASPTDETSLVFLRHLFSFPATDLAAYPLAIPILTAVLRRHPHDHVVVKAAVVRILALLLPIVDSAAIKSIAADAAVLSAVVSVVKDSEDVPSRSDAARVLSSIAAVDAASRFAIASTEGSISGIARLLEETEEGAIDAALSCLVELSSARRYVARIVASLGRALGRSSLPVSSAEKAIRLVAAAAMCAEGRSAVCDDSKVLIGAVVERMVKLSGEGRESALLILWTFCCLHPNRNAVAAVADGNGLARILVMVQSGCSPPARQMAGDLLRLFSNNTSSSLSNYISDSAHITPF